MAKILNLLIAVFISLLVLKGQGMAQDTNMDHGYYAKIQTDGLVWTLAVNDVYVRENGDANRVASNGRIGLQLIPGENTISLLFSPITGEMTADGRQVLRLRDGLLIEIAIERRDFATQQSVEITPIVLRYSAEQGEFLPESKTIGGVDRVLKLPGMSAAKPAGVSEEIPNLVMLASGEMIDGYRLDFTIDLDDPDLWPFHWRQDAVQLVDSPEMRAELMQAYRQIHGYIASGDSASIMKQARPVWDRAAYMLTTDKKNADEFVASSQLGLGLFQPQHPDGSVLQELDMVRPIESASLQFMDGNRLVRIRPDPIIWALPPGGDSNITSEFPVVFYKTTRGEWRIADINIGL